MKKVPVFLLMSLFCFGQNMDNALTKVESTLLSLRTFTADFEQVFYSSSVSIPLREKGVIHFQKPDTMKWEYKYPEPKIFLSREGSYQYYIPEDNQLYRGKIPQEGAEGELLYILSGKRRLQEGYQAESAPFPTNEKNVWQIKLTPKEESTYSHVLLEIDKKSGLIGKILLFDLAGNKTELIFTKIKTNTRFAKGIFDLKVPPDVEIIEY